MNATGAPIRDTWTVPPESAGTRLDRHVAEFVGESRNAVQRWIDEGRLWLEGKPAKASTTLKGGEQLALERPPRQDQRIQPEAGELAILHSDPDLIVLDKPAGLTVHPGAGRATGTLVHRLLARYPELAGVGGPGRPGIVHRLDKDTTGVLVVARTPAAYQTLSRAFSSRAVAKTYLAVVYGTPREPAGTINRPIGRHAEHRKEMTVRPDGRPAVSHYRTRSSRGGLSWLEVDIETGRTHQIRVHLKALGHPLVGDAVYGEARWRGLPRPVQKPLAAFSRPALHAWRLRFRHPGTGEEVAFEAPVPDDLKALWRAVAGGEPP
ncbi:MAG: RluA family pseudouridine synthase [Thermoanaerobaculia bacterium]|nr:RluA family pseudouridine synthase [Thermoanaerobaculia bacterium]